MKFQMLILLGIGGVLAGTPTDNGGLDKIPLRPLNEILASSGNLMSDDDQKTVDDVFDITNDILDIGAEIQPLEEIFGPLSALGKLVLDCFHLGKRDDPVMDKLNDISHQINELGKQMTQQFADLKLYITETIFDTEIVQPALLLNQFMQDTISFPGNDSISRFYTEYQRYPPLEMGYKLMGYMSQTNTNPLYQAMQADDLKKASTFQKWSSTLLNVMFQFMYIETYANGMFDNSTLYGPHRLEDKLHDLNTTIQGWNTTYKNSYWPSVVQKLIEDTQDTYINESNDQKARRLKDGLEQILQDDQYIYYAIVYNPLNGYKEHGVGGANYLFSFRRGKCNAIVMRTTKSKFPNYGVDNALNAKTVLERNQKKKDDNRCLKMLNDAEVYNPTATANAFIVDENPAIYPVATSIPPGRTAYGWGAWWISTY